MPTKKPRVTVTLEPSAYQVLKDMAAMGKTSPGQVLSELVEPVMPALEKLVKAAKDYARWQASMRSELSSVHADVQANIGAIVEALEGQMKGLVGDGGLISPPDLHGPPEGSSSPAEGAGRASIPRSHRPVPEAPSGAIQPPYSNTGVKMSRNQSNQRVSKGQPVYTKRGRKNGV